MRYGAHLPLIDFDSRGWDPIELTGYARTAVELGFAAIAVNDHLTFRRPWLDGIVALAGVVADSADLMLVTTAALPVIRGAAPLAAAADSLDLLSGGRVRLGLAPGSSAADFALVGADFADRWRRFDHEVAKLRTLRPAGPLWIASWGSPAGLRRVARLGDGWLASAYNTTPELVAAGRAVLGAQLPCIVATMWVRITQDPAERSATLNLLAATLGRPPELLADRVLVGPVDHCVRLTRAYAAAGVELLCLWPIGEPERQLRLFMTQVAPRAV